MPTATSLATHCVRYDVHRDLPTVRRTLQRIRQSDYCADLCLFRTSRPGGVQNRIVRLASDRRPVCMPIHVTPVTFDGWQAELVNEGGVVGAVTQDVSLRGVGFTHGQPLRGHYAIVTFDLMDGPPVSLLLEIRWSNVRKGDAKMSGGMFLAVADTPHAVGRRCNEELFNSRNPVADSLLDHPC